MGKNEEKNMRPFKRSTQNLLERQKAGKIKNRETRKRQGERNRDRERKMTKIVHN